MKFRTKLLTVIISLMVLPLLLAYLGLVIFGGVQFHAIQNNSDKNLVTDVFSTAAIQIFGDITEETQRKIYKKAAEDPDQFLERAILDEVNQELTLVYSHLVVSRDGTAIYCGDSRDDLNWLPSAIYGKEEEEPERGHVFFFDHMLIQSHDLTFSDGTPGSVYIVTRTNMLGKGIRAMFTQVFMMIFIVITVVALIVVAWIYREMVQPIHLLQKATKEIKEGNLDFQVDTSDKGEIGDLCRDFEEMRLRLKDTYEEKIQFDAESKALISNISHDLKTPVTTIKGYAEGILDGVASSPEKVEKYIRTIYNKANDMDRLIDELTLYSKIDTNRIPYTFAKINIAEYFKDCVEERSIELESRNIELGYFNYLDDDVIVIADAEQLRRVVNNIIGNSAKYMDKKKGIINIRLKDVGDFVQVEIEDNGKGIGAKDLPYIFDRFYRTDSSRTSSTGGSGIGLSIVRKIIEDHGGKIWATSKEG
ncbi:MAG: HAMP domain-containing histidine kinase, partial [Lachnospiraceae bacterium]|nr:HAMP domain-containing histidine kinase [Lachnospiraceae bacterium]